jgi:hypothetical protein
METGNIQSCSNLNEKSKICDMTPCIESVKCLLNTSASNTDTWIVTFKDDGKIKVSNTLDNEKRIVELELEKKKLQEIGLKENMRNLDNEKRTNSYKVSERLKTLLQNIIKIIIFIITKHGK